MGTNVGTLVGTKVGVVVGADVVGTNVGVLFGDRNNFRTRLLSASAMYTLPVTKKISPEIRQEINRLFFLKMI